MIRLLSAMVFTIAAVVFVPQVAYADMEATELGISREFMSRCINASNAQNFAGASVYCQSAAEHLGNLADMTTGRNADIARGAEITSLSLCALANSAIHEKQTGRNQLRTARELLKMIHDKNIRATSAAAISKAITNGEY